jgi:exodeoxyribonuclease VII small subunit
MTATNLKGDNPNLPIEEMNYEQAFSALEAAVAALESEKQSLDETMLLFERGQALIRRCMELLDKAELKVRLLSGEELEDFSPQAS